MIAFKMLYVFLLLGFLFLLQRARGSAPEQCPQNPGKHVNYSCVGQVCPHNRLCESPCNCVGYNFYACYGHCDLPVRPHRQG
ncbi:hypothetical protein V5799_008128 [Amblyomma americanum]|uniref:Secreted protein n=1 Tax=Amblyomma americanum TaxID=6943 RepID=A0AAQ4FEZ5_AMBAM